MNPPYHNISKPFSVSENGFFSYYISVSMVERVNFDGNQKEIGDPWR